MAKRDVLTKKILSLLPGYSKGFSGSIVNTERPKSVEEVKDRFLGFDREHIWAFTAGQK